MDCIPQLTSVLPILLLPPALEVEGGATTVEEVLQEDVAANQIAEEENRQVLAPLPLDLLRDRKMRAQHRIPHQILKEGRVITLSKILVMTFYLAFFADNSSIPHEVVRNT